MKIIKAKYILTCDEEFKIYKDKAVVFDEFIIDLLDFKDLENDKFKNADIIDHSNDILMPSFINPHTHLEYSANSSELKYGDFIIWLSSVIKNRSTLSANDKVKFMKNALKNMMKSGVSTVGEISSFGADFDIFEDSKPRVIFFNEILGSNPNVFETNWDNFLQRFEHSMKKKSSKFIPAISIHSPYSTAPKLAKKALDLAKEKNLLVSTHFLESEHELNWLENGKGEFASWLKNFNKNASPMYSPNSFIEMFKGVRTLFTHCVFAKDYFEEFDRNLHFFTHCPRSNKLLSKAKLNLTNIKDSVHIATDGLSSNNTLNFWDELRAALFIHDEDILEFSKFLILASTKNAAKAINLNLGQIKKGKIADFAIYKGFGEVEENELALQLILKNKEVEKLIIEGELCHF